MKKIISAIFFIYCSFLFSQSYWGRVIKVHSGDMFEMQLQKINITVRLFGVDCPESGQNFFDKAKEFLTRECANKTIIAERLSEDRFGTIFAKVKLPDGRILNEEILKNGYGWTYQNALNDYAYKQLEMEARKSQKGLWSEENPIAPWDYRKGVRVAIKEDLSLKDKDIYRDKKGFYYLNKSGRRIYLKNK